MKSTEMEHVTKKMKYGLELSYSIMQSTPGVSITIQDISLKRVRYVSNFSNGDRLAKKLNVQMKTKQNKLRILEYTPNFLDHKNGWRLVWGNS